MAALSARPYCCAAARTGDILDRHLLDRLRSEFEISAFFHLAAIPSVPRSIDDPVPSHDVNLNGTFNVFRAAVQAKVRRVVFAASSSAYGDTPVLPKPPAPR